MKHSASTITFFSLDTQICRESAVSGLPFIIAKAASENAKPAYSAGTLGILSHPRVTSSIIISTNPNENAMVPQFECFPSDISGINSSTTTYIIAPAAKASR